MVYRLGPHDIFQTGLLWDDEFVHIQERAPMQHQGTGVPDRNH